MTKILEARILPENYTDTHLLTWISGKLQVSPQRIRHWEIIRRSIDARKKPVKYVLKLQVWVDQGPIPPPLFEPRLQGVENAPEIHIVGMGPCGLFAALHCITLGYKPVIWERGKAVRARRRDLAQLTREGLLNPDSNYCFGEGGAGTFSDGKLYTRSTKRGDIRHILDMLVYFGAPQDILIDSHPHIGTNKLPKIIEQIRNTILECGGEIGFGHRLTGISLEGGQLKGIQFNHGLTLPCSALLLATGHSARDIFQLLYHHGVPLESKAFALGLRVEHSQELIDQIQYHCEGKRPDNLPPSSYQWVRQAQDRGVHSFCMCPGGIICPAATAPNEVVVNGWSPSRRNGKFANSGIVVQVLPEDIPSGHEPLGLMQWQQQIEQRAFEAGGGKFWAPAQRLTDFLRHRNSSSLPDCSYLPGIHAADLHQVLPQSVAARLVAGFQGIGKKMQGYITEGAVVVGVESRTSSPVRIPRDPTTYQHPACKGLYPCGEGGGYAGGIMSAAIDGWKTAHAACMSVGYRAI